MNNLFDIEEDNDIIIINFKNNDVQMLYMTGISCYYEDPKYIYKYIYKYHLFNKELSCLTYTGHNISLDKLLNYLKIANNKYDILYEEKKLYEKLLKFSKYKSKKYIITKCKNDKNTLSHEYKHALYFLNEKYRNYIKEIWESINDALKKIIIDYLVSYHETLYLDEFQAYLTTDPSVFINCKIKNKNKNKNKIKPAETPIQSCIYSASDNTTEAIHVV